MSGFHDDSSVAAENEQRLALPDEDDLLAIYYEGGRLPSPFGGFLMVLGVRPVDEGAGSLLLECTASSLRYQMSVPKATRAERKKVRGMIDAGSDPECPRHLGQLLMRIRHDFACSRCGMPRPSRGPWGSVVVILWGRHYIAALEACPVVLPARFGPLVRQASIAVRTSTGCSA